MKPFLSNSKCATPIQHDLEESLEAEEQFEKALGRFIIAWTDAETELYQVLISYSKVSHAVGRALFSGTRARSMVDFIRSIAHNTSMDHDRKEDLEYVFAQMVIINKMRDHLVHYTSSSYSYRAEEPQKRVVANTRASRYGKVIGYEISAETIEKMTWDLYGIANHLNMHWGPRTGSFQAWRENPEDSEPTPWSYKPPQPIPAWENTPSQN